MGKRRYNSRHLISTIDTEEMSASRHGGRTPSESTPDFDSAADLARPWAGHDAVERRIFAPTSVEFGLQGRLSGSVLTTLTHLPRLQHNTRTTVWNRTQRISLSAKLHIFIRKMTDYVLSRITRFPVTRFSAGPLSHYTHTFTEQFLH
jgi:hypothetical protein